MTDTSGSNPFSGFAGFKPSDMLDRMWDMMRLSPFGAGIGAAPGQGLPPSLSAMSDMMAPLASVEELDKRITDLRAVEQWLKLNLGMLQSAIQALEVQRATLATLRAFGALAQESMAAAEAAVASGAEAKGTPASAAPAFASPFGAVASASPEPGKAAGSASGDAARAGAAAGSAGTTGPGAAPGAGVPPTGAEAFDPAGWWNLLQSQFSQLASFAMTQPGAAGPGAAPGGAGEPKPKPAPAPAQAAGPRAHKPATRRAAPPKPRTPRAQASGEAPNDTPPPAAKASRKRSP